MKRKSPRAKNSPRPDRLKLFEDYFAAHYGERWPRLRQSLVGKPAQETLLNPFGLNEYRLDQASLRPVHHLAPREGDRVADFCASPGGKSLAMIFRLGATAQWHCNDLSPGRVQRLKAVFHDCLPPEIMANVHITKSDASRWGLLRRGQFDRILVDAPCSGERHLLQSPSELARWSLKGTKGLAVRQHALLCSALDCLVDGGRLVYSTCSINPLENDGVIERLHESRPGRFRVLPVDDDLGEPTTCGRIILPDVSNCGPIYFCLLELR